jgi:hypothetical protein
MGIDDRPEEQQRAFERRQRDETAAAGLRAGARFGEAFARLDEI